MIPPTRTPVLSYGTGVRTPAENSALTEIIFNIFLATVITSTITKIAESKKGEKKISRSIILLYVARN